MGRLEPTHFSPGRERRESAAMKVCPVCNTESPPTAEFCPRDGTILPDDDGRGTGTKLLYDPLIGELVDGRYKIEARLGEGALSTVYAATHELIEKRVALKVLKQDFVADEEIVERFLREAKAASRLSHENIISLSDFGKVPSGAPFFVMELLDGRILSDRLYEGKGMPIPEALRLITEIGRGLAAAHQHGVVHRDLKPDNIGLVRDEDGTEHVKILDFGLAKIAQENRKLTRVGQVLGTPEYMSPEQASGQTVDLRSDIFALGILLYRLITGQVPFGGDSFMAIISRVLSERPKPPRSLCQAPELTPELEAVILRALARQPEDRYPTMDAMLEALRQATSGLVVKAPPTIRDAAPPTIQDEAPPTIQGEISDGDTSAVASTWVDPGDSSETPPCLEDRATGPTAVASSVPEEPDLGVGPTVAMDTVDENYTAPDIAPPAGMPKPAEWVPDAPVQEPPSAEQVASAAAEVEDALGNLWIEEHTAQRLIRRSAESRARRRVMLISAIIGLLGIAGGVVLAVTLGGNPGRPTTTSGSRSQGDPPPKALSPDAAAEPAVPKRAVSRSMPVQPLPRPGSHTIRLVIHTTPPGATVYLDGKILGRTPLFRDLPRESHSTLVSVAKPGYATQYRKLRIDKDIRLTLPLVRALKRPPPPRAYLTRPRPRPMPRPPRALRDLKNPFATMKP